MKATGLAAAAGLVAGYAAERAVLARERDRPDPHRHGDFTVPADARRLHVATDDGGRLHAVERGRGRPLVLLHGVTLSGVAWHFQLLDLADRFRVLVVDHRGHGRSEAGSDRSSLGRLARDLRAVLVDLDLRDALVVGHSMGGMVLGRFCADHPAVLDERVAGLGFVSTAANFAFAVPGWQALVAATTPVAARGMRLSGRLPGGYLPANDLSYLLARVGFGPRPSPRLVELGRLMSAATPPAVLAELWPDIVGLDLRAELRSVDLPATVVVGTADRLTPPRRARELATCLPGAELTVLEGAGHMAMLERRQEVNAALVRLADRAPAVPSSSW